MVDVVRIGDQPRDEVGVADVPLDELVVDASRLGGVAVDVDSVFLDAQIVEGVHRVEDGHVVAVREEGLGEVAADEPGAAGDEYVHAPTVRRRHKNRLERPTRWVRRK